MSLTVRTPTTKQTPVAVLEFRWNGVVKGASANFRCTACLAPIGDELPFGIAWVNVGDNDPRSMRLCNACGLKAEADLNGTNQPPFPSRVQELAKAVREQQQAFTDAERVELWDAIREGYCRSCGTHDPKCQCWNEE